MMSRRNFSPTGQTPHARSGTKIILAASAVVIFTLGVASTVFPDSHPRGILGILVDHASSNTATAPIRPPVAPDQLSEIPQQPDVKDTPTSAGFTDFSTITSFQNEYTLQKVDLPGISEYWENSQKPVGFIDWHGASGDLVFASGAGQILKFDARDGVVRPVKSNLNALLPPEVREPGKFSVKGLTVVGQQLYISSAHNSSTSGEEDCWSTAVYAAPLVAEPLNFRLFWTSAACVKKSESPELNPHQAGGGLAASDQHLFVATGEYRERAAAQDISSELGAVIAVDLENSGSDRVVAFGLRNPQSMATVDGGMWVTDQGPRGGDEINFIRTGEQFPMDPVNYGWPIASYGIHYSGKLMADAPLLRPHSTHGFQEPAHFFSASIGISSVLAVDNTLFIGGLGNPEEMVEGDNAISVFRISEDQQLAQVDRIEIGDRVRDILPAEDDCLWLVLDSAQLAKLCVATSP